MKLQGMINFQNLTTIDDITAYLTETFHEVYKAFNGNIELGSNVKPNIVSAVFAAANTELSIPHKLGYVPTGYLVCGASVAMSVYDGSTAKSVDRLYLKSSAIGTAQIWVF